MWLTPVIREQQPSLHIDYSSVREYAIKVLGAHSSLPERALEFLAYQSLNANRSVSRDAFWALEKQSFLPAKVLGILATYPKDDNAYFESLAWDLLWKYASYSTPELKMETLRLIYRIGLNFGPRKCSLCRTVLLLCRHRLNRKRFLSWRERMSFFGRFGRRLWRWVTLSRSVQVVAFFFFFFYKIDVYNFG